jgi:CO dehydrogenase/acetyl-CoA synthase beta subunit
MSLFFTLNFLRHGPAGGVFQSDGQGGYRPMPHVLALGWFHEAANGGATYQRFLESGARRIAGGGALGESFFEVEAALFRKSKAATLIVQNCSAASRVFWLPKPLSRKVPSMIETLAAPDLTSTSADVAPTAQPVKGSGEIRVPAYSVTRIVWR